MIAALILLVYAVFVVAAGVVFTELRRRLLKPRFATPGRVSVGSLVVPLSLLSTARALKHIFGAGVMEVVASPTASMEVRDLADVSITDWSAGQRILVWLTPHPGGTTVTLQSKAAAPLLQLMDYGKNQSSVEHALRRLEKFAHRRRVRHYPLGTAAASAGAPAGTPDADISPLVLRELDGRYVLHLVVAEAPVNNAIPNLGLRCNGWTWEGLANYIVENEAPGLDGWFGLDSEDKAFVAYGPSRGALEDLGRRLAPAARSYLEFRRLVKAGETKGYGRFDEWSWT